MESPEIFGKEKKAKPVFSSNKLKISSELKKNVSTINQIEVFPKRSFWDSPGTQFIKFGSIVASKYMVFGKTLHQNLGFWLVIVAKPEVLLLKPFNF